ncbi:MAG: cyclase family protein [Tissierellia bacterium]|nr:cyclase family protein [Tissierellia bacterium]
MTKKYVEIGYPIYEGMPVYPGLPEVELLPNERIEKGDYWNGTVLSIYLHAGTHVDAPWHYVPGAPGIDAIPIEDFIYEHPLLIDVPAQKPDDLITIEQLKEYGDELYEADMLIFNTHHWKYRSEDFMKYATGFPAVAPETAEFIRRELSNCKAVAIDTLSIENIEQGKTNGFATHNTFLDPDKYDTPTILIYEDINPEPIIGKKLKSAFTAPLRIIDHDASIVNIIVEIE